jgi:CheY-like chemotaxis protein
MSVSSSSAAPASVGPDGVPRRAQCLLSSGESFEGLVERVGPTGVFICTARPGLQYSDGVRVTLFDDHGPVSSFTGRVVTWVRGRGIRVEADPDVESSILDQLAEWASERQFDCEPASTPDLVMAAPAQWSPPGARGAPLFEAPNRPSSSPAIPLPGAPPRIATPPNLHRAASQALKGTRVLVIDDDPLVLRMLSRGLTRFGCEVEVCGDPPRALDLLRGSRHDVVLLDWVLPVIPGAEMLEKLRRCSPVPIAVVSGSLWWDRAADQIRSLGASTVLEKPIDFERLVEWIRLVQGAHASS